MAKTALITGASSGIGRVTAELMVARGWRVAVTSRQPQSMVPFSDPSNPTVIPLDPGSGAAALQAAADTARQRLGRIDVLVNNAGYGVFGPLEGTSAEEIQRQFGVNLVAPIDLIRCVMPVMREQGGGTIVNVSSIGGRTASPFAALYHASKFAIEGFSESFRYEAALHGVRVKLVEPAHFRTGFISRSLFKSAHPAYDAAFDNYMKWVVKEDEKAPPPDPVAEAILRAAEDPSERLRYPVKGAWILALTRLLPDRVWRSLMAEGMRRTP